MTVTERESVKWLGTSKTDAACGVRQPSAFGLGWSGEVGKPGASHVQPCPKDCPVRLGALSLVRLSRTGFAPPVLQSSI